MCAHVSVKGTHMLFHVLAASVHVSCVRMCMLAALWAHVHANACESLCMDTYWGVEGRNRVQVDQQQCGDGVCHVRYSMTHGIPCTCEMECLVVALAIALGLEGSDGQGNCHAAGA